AIDNDASDTRIPFEKQTDVQIAAGVGAQWRIAERWFLRGDLDWFDRDHYFAGLVIGMHFGGGQEPVSIRSPEPTPAAAVPAPAPEPKTAPPPEPSPVPVCNDETVALEGVNFASDSEALTDASLAILDDIAQRLRNETDAVATIAAHTDSAGAADYNLALSERRAEAVVAYLMDQGIAATRLDARGLGEGQPIADNATSTGRAANRRVELTWTRAVCR
ncbi:MAG: OmpA family protein, partial [Pseudomonadota bacterium]